MGAEKTMATEDDGIEIAAAVQMAADLEPLPVIIEFIKKNNHNPNSASARMAARIEELEALANPGAWRIIPYGEKVTLAECPVGLFISDYGFLCVKTQYGNNEGRIDAYIVEGGAFFWGSSPQTIENQRRQMVQPVMLLSNGEPLLDPHRKFAMGQRVRKKKGASWQGHVCGFYSTALTPIGYDVESERELNSVQLYPEDALEAVPPDEE
jgi:hypothetical protein